MCYLCLHAFIRYHKTRRNALFFAYFFSGDSLSHGLRHAKGPLPEGGWQSRQALTGGIPTRTLFANLNCIFFAFYGDFQQFCGDVKIFAESA
jgi:hypothetical protein